MTGEPRHMLSPEIRRWRLAPDAWRLSGRVTLGRLERYLRYRSARGLPASMKARFLAMGIPRATIDDVLGDIRRPQRLDGCLEPGRSALSDRSTGRRTGRTLAGGRDRAHQRRHVLSIAHLVTDSDPRILRTLRASSVTTFAQAVPRAMPTVRRYSLPWRTRRCLPISPFRLPARVRFRF